ncbi:ABC transporter ATP-binding protein, partial [Microbacterium sp. B35-04]
MSTSVPSAPAADAARRGSPLRIEGLGLQIGGATILKEVELDIAAGSLVGVIGPNGA